MAKKRGRGFSTVNYPTGMNLGGDPTQALIHATGAGNFVVTLSSTDLGQGLKTIATQIAADALGVSAEDVIVDTGDTDTGPFCMGTFASRTTHRVGNAIIEAADEAKEVLLEAAGEELEANPEDLEMDGEGNIQVTGVPERSIAIADASEIAQFEMGKSVAGRGAGWRPLSEVDPETGEMDPDSTEAHAAVVADVEVDTETGEVDVVSLKSVYEIGQIINPALVEGQIKGGAWMGMAHALYETTDPYYPNPEHKPGTFGEYPLPGPAEVPEMEYEVLEIPAESGPYGAKGIGEMAATPPIPAIVNAVNDAIGVRLTQYPITPEDVLRALEEEEGGASSGTSGVAAEGDD